MWEKNRNSSRIGFMKKTIGVVFGGKSVEHDVSIITAHNPIIESLLATQKYEVVPIYIAKDGSWYSDSQMLDINYFRSDLDEKLKKIRKIQLNINNGFSIIRPGTHNLKWSDIKSIKDFLKATGPGPWFYDKQINIDIIFPAMHGTYGEDGSLMGLLRMADVPFVGCDLFASAVAMDKVLTKQILKSEDVTVVPDVWFTNFEYDPPSHKASAGEGKQKILEKIKKLHYPLFVKPVHLGSSIGMSKVKNETELENAIELAFHYDDKVLVEEGVPNLIEVTLPIMGNDEPTTAEVERPLNKGDFFDYEEKYIKGSKKTSGVNSEYSEIPASIGEEMTYKVKEIGKNVYKILGCSGIARVDFLIDGQTNRIYVNEVNTLPGSLYQHNWRKAGISNVDLIEKLLLYARERYDSNKDRTHSFSSTILSNYKGSKLQG